MTTVQPMRFMCAIIAGLCACAADAQEAPKGPADGWSGFFLDNVTFQKSTKDALRTRPSPFRPNLVTDSGGRLQNFLGLQFMRGEWTFMGSYADNRTLGSNSAYLSYPLSWRWHVIMIGVD